jgi:hypothetical protein
MGSLGARPLPGTSGSNSPFWSPDSKSIAFFADGKLKRLDLAGGSPQVLCDAAALVFSLGGAWGPSGDILFSGVDGIHRVPASGGAPVLLTTVDAARHETVHSEPQFLEGGKAFLYFVASTDANTRGVYAATLDRPRERTRILATDFKAMYAAARPGSDGTLFWLRENILIAQAFDTDHLRLTGKPATVAEDILVGGGDGRAAFWVSDAGVLVWRSRASLGTSRIVWRSRDGKLMDGGAPEDQYGSIALSPDEKRIAMRRDRPDGTGDIWIFEPERNVTTRLRSDSSGNGTNFPLWSPDGHAIAFVSMRAGIPQIFRKDISGATPDQQVTANADARAIIGLDWTADGRYILIRYHASQGGIGVAAIPVAPDAAGNRKPVVIVDNVFNSFSAQVSPDGKWVAYDSNESGSGQIYLQAFPVPGGRWQISVKGGAHPTWKKDGTELYFDQPGTEAQIMAATIRASADRIEAGTPRALFSLTALPVDGSGRIWAPSRDGQRFLVIERVNLEQVNPVIVTRDWQGALGK